MSLIINIVGGTNHKTSLIIQEGRGAKNTEDDEVQKSGSHRAYN